MEYVTLTHQAQQDMLSKRLSTYEQQHFDATQNLRMLKATRGDAREIVRLEGQILDLETCIGILLDDLDK